MSTLPPHVRITPRVTQQRGTGGILQFTTYSLRARPWADLRALLREDAFADDVGREVEVQEVLVDGAEDAESDT